MNNFAKTESLPKAGHVNEVCKEWLVREDGALAYKLQSEEINDFYKGNRTRNAVVREDFPTALHEQIKEKENAERQTEVYRRRLLKQEQHDKRVAKEIAVKMERDLQEKQYKQYMESEMIAQQMQEIYVNLPTLPPPAIREKMNPPPRPSKANVLSQQPNEPSFCNSRHQHHISMQPQQPQYQPKSDECISPLLATVGSEELSASNTTSLNDNSLLVSDATRNAPPQPQTSSNKFVDQSPMRRGPPALTNDNIFTQNFESQIQCRDQYISSKTSAGSTSFPFAAISAAPERSNVFDKLNSLHHILPHPASSPHTPLTPHLHTITSSVGELNEYSDAVDSIRQYDICSMKDMPVPLSSHSNINKMRSPSNENLLRTEQKFQKLSPEKYDQLVGNNTVHLDIGAAAERHMQQHADDIELYVNPCDYESLQEIGLPLEEIKELSKKLKQEQKDEILARRLQQMEVHDGKSQEERDRLLAIEAQDKELAKMLQEREKAKVKRAKEKARLRKSQQKEMNGLYCGPILPLPQDCLSSSKYCMSATSSVVATNTQSESIEKQHDSIELDAYSNPIDIIHNQRMQNRPLRNDSLISETANSGSNRHDRQQQHSRDDDIYVLPVDSCRIGQRPNSLHIGTDHHLLPSHNSMSKSTLEAHESSNEHDVSTRLHYFKTGSFDQNSSPTPPYMPIQGTKRSNSGEDRKKKSKDKCTHQ